MDGEEEEQEEDKEEDEKLGLDEEADFGTKEIQIPIDEK